jgi:hypothetical protein
MGQQLEQVFGTKNTIEFQGQRVHRRHRLVVRNGDTVKVRFLAHKGTFRQGLSLNVGAGKLLINGQEMKKANLFVDTAPHEVEILCKVPRTKESTWLSLYNCWEITFDQSASPTTMAWAGNAGMLVEEQEDRVLLKCSHGEGEIAFDDLVVEIRHQKCRFRTVRGCFENRS